MSDFDKEFEKELKREKIMTFVFWGAIFAYLIWTTNDSDIGHAKLLWAIIIYGSFISYKIYKLEELILKIYTRPY